MGVLKNFLIPPSFVTLDQAKALRRIVRNDVIASRFTLSGEKSNWDPRQGVSFLGCILNFESGMIYVIRTQIG